MSEPNQPTHPTTEEQRYEYAHNELPLSGTRQGVAERLHAARTEGPRLRIAMLAPPWIPVPPPGYGGIEFVVALLTDALVDRGHEVELFCAPGSSSKAKVRPLLDAAHPEGIERSLFEADHVGRAFDIFDSEA